MSKVELSIQEYNDLIESNRIYKELFEAMTTPCKRYDWDMFIKGTWDSASLYSLVDDEIQISVAAQKVLDSRLQDVMVDFKRENSLGDDMVLEPSLGSLTLFTVRHSETPPKEVV